MSFGLKYNYGLIFGIEWLGPDEVRFPEEEFSPEFSWAISIELGFFSILIFN